MPIISLIALEQLQYRIVEHVNQNVQLIITKVFENCALILLWHMFSTKILKISCMHRVPLFSLLNLMHIHNKINSLEYKSCLVLFLLEFRYSPSNKKIIGPHPYPTRSDSLYSRYTILETLVFFLVAVLPS